MADTPDFIATLARSGRMRIAAGLAVTALVGGGLGVIMLRGDEGGSSLLFSGLELEEAAEIVDKLETANIDYKLEGGGSAIFVDRASVDDARMMLSEQGLPTRGSVGWEIFDKTDAFGSTSFVQNINKVRALEGELGRTISSLDTVKAARVHLVLPEKSLFEKEAEKPSASVVLALSGNSMNADKVRAIRNLVASAVPGLTVAAITIVDDQGRTLAAAEDEGESGPGGGAADERKAELEGAFKKKVGDIVENIAGRGAARVEVSLDVDFNRITESSESYDPEGRVLRSSQTRESSSNSAERDPRDTTTVANNVPNGADPAAAQSPPASQTTESTTEETVNYEISKNLRTEVTEGGRIKRLSVAVAVDHQMVPGADGAPPTFTPRTQEELDRILTLVKSAVGYTEARGDVVTVENIPFARPNATLGDAKPPGPFDFDKFDIVRGAEIGALAITALALVFFVLRPLVRGLITRPEESPALAVGQTRARGALANGAGQGAGAAGGDDAGASGSELPELEIPGMERLDAGIDVARITGQVKASSIKKVTEVVVSHPESP